MRRVRRNIVGMFATAAAAVVVIGVAAYACTNLATLNLSNNAGRPGDHITITGSSFITVCVCGPQLPPTPVKIRWNGVQGEVLAEVSPDRQTGALTAAFTVPDARPGYYVIAATQRDDTYNIDNAGTPALASFEVLGPNGESTVQPSDLGSTAPRSDESTSSAMIALTAGLGVLGLALFVGGSAVVIRQVTTRKSRVPATISQD